MDNERLSPLCELSMKKILLVEDNREVAGILFDYFESLEMQLDYADNGELGLQLALNEQFDAIILDLMLPRMDGLSVCKALRKQGNNTPILMLTALDSREDMLNGFDHGADDYLSKPFDLDILVARVEALIRRYKGNVCTTELRCGPLTINQTTREVHRQQRLLTLNPTSYKILELLCLKHPQVVTKQEIIEKIWQQDPPNNDVLRSHIYQLRTQLDKPFTQAMLITVSKVGFRLQPDDK